MSASFSEFFSVPPAINVRAPMGASSVVFNSAIVYGQPNETGANALSVFVSFENAGGGEIEIAPGQSITISAPLNGNYTADQIYIRSQSAGDGVVVFWSLASFKTFNNVEMKLERACLNLIRTISTTIDDCSVTSGFSDDQLGTDSICVMVPSGVEELIDSALWKCQVTVRVRSRAKQDASMELHRMRTAYVRDLFMDSQLTSLLTVLEPNFFAQPESVNSRAFSSTIDPDTKHYISELTFSICCAGNSVS